MMLDNGFIRRQFLGQKPKLIILRLTVCFLFFILAILLLFSTPIQFYTSPDQDSVIQTITTSENEQQQVFPTVNSPENSTESQHNHQECDIFNGLWVQQEEDSSGPAYTNETCPFIEDHQNCIKNGRPDFDYLFWKWKPLHCDLPKFDPTKFLNLMRHKSWAFVGDSISRNQVQSLLCSLYQVEQANEIYHDKDYRSKKWHFPIHNFTLSVIWTPFLLKASIFEDANGFSSDVIQLHLDKLDQIWTQHFADFDYIVIAGGKWFLKTAVYYENNTITGCHYCSGKKNLTELGFEHAYRKALQLIFKFMITSSNHYNVNVLFRTTTPDHFENGEWFSGGYCNRTVPFERTEIVDLKGVDEIMRNIELEEFSKIEGGLSIKLLDTTRMLLLRPDGHPGPYRQFQPFAIDNNAKVQTDCLHWCLPGPMDSINDLLLEMISRG
ncbi:protein trichome birefringence-like 24 [Impatiens glandulifera]|uniref:protein trichome birefringence-like 24 n=1 Tax=Impatiens glandulifera TaxID=253017 RepID=UPI001FB17F3D|nr:protein trichome birefringence-like 24 [Impatiens glandulifera]